MWNQVEPAPPDAILGLTEAFQNDDRPGKVNLGVGVYKDASGTTPVLQCVKEAEQRILEEETTKSYLPIAGQKAYGDEVQKLLFGAPCERAVTVHTPGGTGALRLAAELLKQFSSRSIWVSNPTWANHTNIFKAADLTVRTYPYYKAETHDLDEAALFDALEQVPAGDCVLLHACCHNPTGVDLTPDQWRRIAGLAAQKGFVILVDFAYQGLAEGIEADRAGVETLLGAGIDFFVASSFSKNFGLYRERTGALTAVTASATDAATAASHMKKNARVIYSNPPAHGGLIVTTVLQDAALLEQWKRELTAMRDRINGTRKELADGLAARGVPQDFSFMTRQKGMFSLSGLNKDQVACLREQNAVYIVGSGRINVAGLAPEHMDAVCDAVAGVMKKQTG